MPLNPYQRFLRHRARWSNCKRCALGSQRRNICLFRGSVPCDILFIGEAPGVSEDLQGRPFVGPAGHLLDLIIRDSIGSLRFGLTNLVACFPREAKKAGTNEPEKDEINTCKPRLEELIKICAPSSIISVGKLAEKHHPGDARIYHPASILRLDDPRQGAVAIKKCVAVIRRVLNR